VTLGNLVEVQFLLETVSKKSVKNLSHQAAYNNDVTFRSVTETFPYQIPLRFPVFFTVLSGLSLTTSENDVHSYHAYSEKRYDSNAGRNLLEYNHRGVSRRVYCKFLIFLNKLTETKYIAQL
jgi:hypothetical protein